jgi:hypothetical protein
MKVITIYRGNFSVNFRLDCAPNTPRATVESWALNHQTAEGYDPRGYGFDHFTYNPDKGLATWSCGTSAD